MFIHDELHLLQFFGKPPTVDEEWGPSLSFEHEAHGHRAVFGFNVATSDCSVQVWFNGLQSPLVSIVYLDSPGARIVQTKTVPYLEIGAPGSAPGSTSEWLVPSHGIRLWVTPSIKLESFHTK
jgi:hypothetical protein